MTQSIVLSKQIILCADDYAQNEAISEGIIRLAEKRRINAISCMVNSDTWAEAQHALHAIQPTTFIGLHLNLTDGPQCSDLPRLIKQAYLRQLNVDVVAATIQSQIDAYTNAMNAYPDFIDGHQHVHQLPVIRDVLLSIVGRQDNVFLRKTSNGWRDLVSIEGFPKRQLIALLGGRTFQHRLKQMSLRSNTSFSGIYNFKNAAHYRHYFQRFLMQTQDQGLIMCHPGNHSDDTRDPLHLYRHYEFNYLMSDDFLSDLRQNSCQLRRKEVLHHDYS